MSSHGTTSRQQSIDSTEAVSKPTETPSTSLASSRAHSITSLTTKLAEDASSTDNLLALLDNLRSPYPLRRNEYNLHALLDPHKPTRPSKTTRKDGLSRFAHYLRDPVYQRPRQYAFPTFISPYNTQDAFDWRDPGCRWWVRQIWLRKESGKGEQYQRRSDISEQTKLWKLRGEEELHYRTSDSRRLPRGELVEGEEEEEEDDDDDETRQVLALIEEGRQVPQEPVRAGSTRSNQGALSNSSAEVTTNCDLHVSATLEYASATLEKIHRTRQASCTQHNNNNSPPTPNVRYWTDREIRHFPESWRQVLLKDPSRRVSKAFSVSHPRPRSALMKQGFVGESPAGSTPPLIDTLKDRSSSCVAEPSRLRHQGRNVQYTDIRAPSPRFLTNAALVTTLPMLHYGLQGQSTSTSVPLPINSHGQSRTARSGPHLFHTPERPAGPSTASFAPPGITMNQGPSINYTLQPPRSRYGGHPGQDNFNVRPVARPTTSSSSAVLVHASVPRTLRGRYNTGTMPSQIFRTEAKQGHCRHLRASSRASVLTNPSEEEQDSDNSEVQRQEILRSLVTAHRPENP